MILKAKERGDGIQLARYLLSMRDNDHVALHDVRGFVSDDLLEAFQEADAVASGTRCVNHLFSMSFNPPPTVEVSTAQFEAAIEKVEHALGLAHQPRAIVFHEKNGRRHAHAVWSRIEISRMRAINVSHYKRKLVAQSRALFVEHGWDLPPSLHPNADRNPENYSQEEAGQAARANRDPVEIKRTLQAAWAQSDSRSSFAVALLEHGFVLARGDRGGFVAVDGTGEVYSLSRWLGVKARDLRARLEPAEDLPSVQDAKSHFSWAPAPEHCDDHMLFLFEARRKEMVDRQRDERSQLDTLHREREEAGAHERAARLPRGLRGLWSRVTGRHQEMVATLEAEAESAALHAAKELQQLVQRHLAERKALELTRPKLEQEKYLKAVRRYYGLDPRQPLIERTETPAFFPSELRTSPALILEFVADKAERFGPADVARVMRAVIGDADEAQALTDRALLSPELVACPDDPARFSTRAFLKDRDALHRLASDMSRYGGFAVAQRHIDRAIADRNDQLAVTWSKLSDEQIEAVAHITQPTQLSCVVGLAGAGKSTLLAVARDAWERQGHRVYGAALAAKAAEGLEAASGVPSRTLASLERSWATGHEPLDHGDILMIDEAGMVGTRQLKRVSDALAQRGCKLVLVGDPDQLQPIEAGRPFAEIAEDIGAARLNEIRRQRSEWQRSASRALAEMRTEDALDAYATDGAVRQTDDRDTAITSLIDAYLADLDAHGANASRIALAHRRKDVHAINQGIRIAQRLGGEGGPEVLVDTDDGPRAFSPGDRLLFTRNVPQIGVTNGLIGTVESVNPKKFTVSIDARDGKPMQHVTFSPDDVQGIDHGFAVSMHRAQGTTVDRSFVYLPDRADRHLTYVALTRHREGTSVFRHPPVNRRVDEFEDTQRVATRRTDGFDQYMTRPL